MTSPSVVSNSLGIRLTKLDLDEPVDPIIPIVSPELIFKLISFNIGLKIATHNYHLEKACQLWYNTYKGMYYGKDN